VLTCSNGCGAVPITDIRACLLNRVSPHRLQDLTLDLVRMPSPTGRTRGAAMKYADILRSLGLTVSLDQTYPDAPSVIARLAGIGGGPTLQLDGHIDTIDLAHDQPHAADGLVYGRGAADMKGSLAAMAEAARALVDGGVKLKGDVLLTAHGLHEAPTGHGEGLRALIQKGVCGDAVIVTEGGSDSLPIIGKGMGIFEITISRQGDVLHELMASPSVLNPILVGHDLVSLIRARTAELAGVELPYVGPESYFVAIFTGGDFYNRVPTSCHVIGTRRYAPERTFSEVQDEFQEIVQVVQRASPGVEIALQLTRIRDGLRLKEDELIVTVVRRAYEQVTGQALPLGGAKFVADASIFVQEGRVPAVYHGPRAERAHATPEYVAVAELVRATRVYVLSAIMYCGLA
jgi:acetylornithine deacetylase/succinyl-diaminopimelate desuccinylase-like protein